MKKFLALPLYWKITIGLVLGVVWVILSAGFGWAKFTDDWIDPFGTIFLRLLKLIAVPLVLFSIIKGISGITESGKLGRLGAKTIVAYLLTTVFAIGIGLTLVNIVKPGSYIEESQRIENRISYEKWVYATDGVEILDGKQYWDPATVSQEELSAATEVPDEIKAKKQTADASKDQGPLHFLVHMVPDNIFLSLNDNSLMLQVIFFAIFFGVTLLMIPGEKAAPVISFVDGTNEVFLKMVDLVMQASPLFVFALMAGTLSEMAGNDLNKLIELFLGLLWYTLLVIFGLLLMIFVIYPLFVTLFVKEISYKQFFKAMSSAQLLAFSSSSSAATLPITMDCVNKNLGVSKNVTSFVLPIGATVNMDGTSLYQAIAVIFLAQLHWVDLNVVQQLTIILTATLASIGSAAVPSAGLVMLIIVLESVGLNPGWIAIILPIDRILDMIRTVVNVTGDATVSSVIAKSEGETLGQAVQSE